MHDWALVIVASLFGSLFSLIGGVVLLSKRISIIHIQRVAIPFAAGALFAAAFIDLLPEALDSDVPTLTIMIVTLVGLIGFFMLERFLGWFHHHHEHHDTHEQVHSKTTRWLLVVGDVLHNSIDGMVIGAAFLANPAVGLVTTVAIAAHEVPKEIGNFGALLALGMRRRNVLLANLFAAFVTVVFSLLVYGFGSGIRDLEPILLALATGMFIYIAASDLIPTIHEEKSSRVANYQTLILIFGIVLVGVSTTYVESTLDAATTKTSQTTRQR
jgi:zinc and cadmium transporter